MTRRFLQGLEQGVRGPDRQTIRIIDHADLSLPHQRPINELLFDVPDLFDLDLRRRQFAIRFDDDIIGMGACRDLMARAADPASVLIVSW